MAAASRTNWWRRPLATWYGVLAWQHGESPSRERSTRVARRVGIALALIVVSLAGTTLGLRVGGRVQQDVGPFTASFTLVPSVDGGTEVDIPPLGSLRVATHAGPAQLRMQLDSIDERRAKAFLRDPQGVADAGDSAVPDVSAGVTRVILQSAAVSVLGAMLLAAIVFRRIRRVAICGVLALVTVAGAGGIAAATFRPGAIEEPTYRGLLSNAPAVIGDAHAIADRFDAYRAELQGLVTNVTRIYETMSTLPVYEPSPHTVRVLHISDLHLNPAAFSVIATVVAQFHIDVVVDTGDINDWGTTMESSFTSRIGKLKVPYVFIRGNHDSPATARVVTKQPNAHVLENSEISIDGLTFAGIGDPRFTPDKTTVETPGTTGGDHTDDPLWQSGERLAKTVLDSTTHVDVAMVHDPASADPLVGVVPVILAGHLHHRETQSLMAPGGETPTLLLVEGSTGGAGLRGLQGETPTPLEMSVLYFDSLEHKLKAYDEITLGGTGESQVTLERHVVKATTQPTTSPSR